MALPAGPEVLSLAVSRPEPPKIPAPLPPKPRAPYPKDPPLAFPRPGRAAQEVARADRRWFLAVAIVFGASIVGLTGGLALYRLTGPHPQVTLLLRRLRRIVHWVIPRSRNPPKWWW